MTGLLGGTFDPPHLGHLALAQEAALRFDLDRVVFIPSRLPPHKRPDGITPFEHRIEMVRLAVAGNPSFEVADMEPNRGPSFTIRLLERARGLYPDPVFIIGLDSLIELPTWRDYPAFLDLAAFVAGIRPGFDPSEVPQELLARVRLFDMPGLWISSSSIRERFARGTGTRYLTPEPVREYAIRERLYG
jgi:nicotinate-nucleotide adenylyltransferase